MGLPPIISLLTATFPILRRGKLSAEDFIFDAESVLVDAAAIVVINDLFKNRRRVSLHDILIFLAITFYKLKHPGRSTGRITYRLGEEHTLVRT